MGDGEEGRRLEVRGLWLYTELEHGPERVRRDEKGHERSGGEPGDDVDAIHHCRPVIWRARYGASFASALMMSSFLAFWLT